MTKRAALVLAGGQARRFQMSQQNWQDKALILFENKPFLVHAIENVSCAVDEIIVCVNDEARRWSYLEVLENYHLRAKVVVDEKTAVEGPICAVLTGLKAAQVDHCLIVPCDMPFVRTNIVDHLFSLSKDFEIVMPMWPNGKLETLFMVLERSIGLEIVQTLCQLGRSHVDDIPRAAAKVLFPSPVKDIKNFDPQLKSFININYPDDIEKMQTRNIQGPIRDDTQFLREPVLFSDLQVMREAVKTCQENNFSVAHEKFESCKRHFEDCNSFFWTALACEGKGNTLLKQLRLQKNMDIQTILSYTSNGSEAFFDAANNYDKEVKLYEKKCCIRLLERALTDKNRCNTL
jgi:molybdopterin-guanine dinucleotide biosynthesis protein A